jgi:NAD(P)-dependent dehydrogenase (short-subunit alcohol dehydrogenase family)
MTRGLFDLTGKVVLATGANSGIGYGFLMGCAKQGADVVCWGRRADKNEEALAAFKAAGAGRVHAQSVDVSDEQAVIDGFAATLKAMGRIDCVFANAGFTSRADSFADLTSEMYHALIDTNQHGVFYTLREAARHMRQRAQAGDAGGSIAICGSLSIFHGVPGMPHYAAAKGAAMAMMKTLALDMGPYKVRANMVAAGLIMTGMSEGAKEVPGLMEKFESATPLKRVGYPEDFEGIGAYLASDASSFHTGDVIVIDGGRMITG